MSQELAKVRCTILEDSRDTGLAFQIEQSQARGAILRVWIPRSQVEHISKRDGVMASMLELPEWLAEAKGLDYE